MEPLYGVLLIVATFIVLAVVIAQVEGLAFLGPASTRGVQSSAQSFCTERCRTDGRCPLTGTAESAGNCPLWGFVEADLPTMAYGSPFEAQRT
jgi:hypothetical protein